MATEPYQDFDGSIVISFAKAFSAKKQGVLAADLTVTSIIDTVLNVKTDNDAASPSWWMVTTTSLRQRMCHKSKATTSLNPELTAPSVAGPDSEPNDSLHCRALVREISWFTLLTCRM
ncbi:hypothetical protein OK016_10655 [Vibrio chagasii]|nr:hypothetical protein [Vibrio chagasii]